MGKIFDQMKKTLGEGLKAVKKGADAIAEKTPEVASAIAEKTQDAVSAGKLNLKIQALKRDVEKRYTDLGRKAYDLTKRKTAGIEEDEAVKRHVKSVDALKREIDGLEKRVSKLKKGGGKTEAGRAAGGQSRAASAKGTKQKRKT